MVHLKNTARNPNERGRGNSPPQEISVELEELLGINKETKIGHKPSGGINPNQRIVIMAAGKCKRWGNYLGIPKQLAEVNGEPIIKRTIRLLKERGVGDIWVTVREYGQYGDLGVNEHITSPNEVSIDRVWGAKELAPCIYLYGDVYYTEEAIDTILENKSEWQFFGRRVMKNIKNNREIYAIKANAFLIQKAGELRELHLSGKLSNSLGQHLHCYMIGIPINPRSRNFIFKTNEIADHHTDINDLTDDFDHPRDYRNFLKLFESSTKTTFLPASPIAPPVKTTKPIRPIRNAVQAARVKSGYRKTVPVKNYYTIDRLTYDVVNELLPKIPDVDLIVGIPRDGIIVAYLISIYRNIPFTDLDSYLDGRIYTPGIKHRKSGDLKANMKSILLVDDICASGSAMRDAKARIPESNVQVYAGVVYASSPAKKLREGLIDCYACELVGTRHYQWTHCDAFHLPGTMMDIDGILCPDWTGSDDAGLEYEEWLKTVPLKICPKNVGTLITWRREEHRGITENWLKSKGVTYGNLIMADRENWGSVGEYKAHYYKQSDARLFIESNSKQAKQIYELTRKPTICFLTNEAWGVGDD